MKGYTTAGVAASWAFLFCERSYAMVLNGQNIFLPQPLTLLELLQEQGYRPQLVAVERGGVIVKRSDYAGTIITDADHLEIVSFVGGG